MRFWGRLISARVRARATVALAVVMAAVTLGWAVSATLPYFEILATDTNVDATKTTAQYVAAEEAIKMAFRQRLHGAFKGVAGTDISTDAHSSQGAAIGDMDNDGDQDLVVVNNLEYPRYYANGGGGAPYSTGSTFGLNGDTTVRDVVVGDLNGDGLLDVAYAGASVRVFVNNGTATPFSSGQFTAFGGGTGGLDMDMDIGDVDADGDLDIVSARGRTGQASVSVLYRNDGTGNFTESNITSATAVSPGIALGDLDADGDLDIVLARANQQNRIYFNNGSGGWVNGRDVTSDTFNTRAVALADVDNDGDLDILTANFGQKNRAYLNDGSATSFEGVDIASDTDDSRRLTAVDYDADGDMDVVVANENGDYSKLYANDGSGISYTASNLGTYAGETSAVVAGDVDNDGDIDLITANANAQINKLYLNGGSAAPFASGLTSVVGSDADTSQDIAVGDLDDDGDLDVVAGNNGATNKLYLNNGTTSPFAGVTGANISTDVRDTRSIVLADVNRDGKLDVITGNYNQRNRLYLNDGYGDFSSVVGLDIGTGSFNTQSLAVADIDGDGDLDVLEANFGEINYLYLNNGSVTPFASVVSSAISSDTHNTWDIEAGDLDRDGDLDVVVSNAGSQYVRYYLNNGTSTPFSGVAGVNIGSSSCACYELALADFDGDGDLDIARSSDNFATRVIYKSNFDMTYYEASVGSTAIFARTVAAGDVDGDGDIDLIAGRQTDTPLLFRNNGTSSPFLAAGTPLTTETSATWTIVVGDMDSDGNLDAVGAKTGKNRLYLNDARSNPVGGFRRSTLTGTRRTFTVATGDVDRDGDLDIIRGNAFGGPSQLYLNNGTSAPFAGVVPTDIGSGSYYTHEIQLGDVDSDGDLDAVISVEGGQLQTFINNGTSTPFSGVAPVTASILGCAIWAMQLGDINHDGALDAVVGCPGGLPRYLLGNGTSNPFSSASSFGTATNAGEDLAITDLDSDGRLDIVSVSNSSTNRRYYNTGSASAPFGVTDYAGGEVRNFSGVAVADFDSDGVMDTVFGSNFLSIDGFPIRVYLSGLGARTVGPDDNNIVRSMAAGDIDGDGDADVLAGSNVGIVLYLNNGTNDPFEGVKGKLIETGVDYTYDLRVADLDSDGDLDIVGSHEDDGIRIYLQERYKTGGQRVQSVRLTTTPSSNSFYFNATATQPKLTQVSYRLSNNDGASWKPVKPNTNVTFASSGTQIKWQAILSSGSPVTTPVVSEVTVVNRLSDSDSDLLTDGQEIDLGTNPQSTDSDGDGMPDKWEVDNSLSPTSSNATADADSDGLNNLGEYNASTNPQDSDSDNDGMPDGWEVNHSLNPNATDAASDPDSDGVGNLAEYTATTDPQDSDSDNDQMPDGWELNHALSPIVSNATADPDSDNLDNLGEYTAGSDPQDSDSDNDQMPDGWEVEYSLSPTVDTASGDADGDELNNLDEYNAGTDPQDSDSDGDLMTDGWEVVYGTDVTFPDGSADPDSDNLTNLEEFQLGIDPMTDDTDLDGIPDGVEVDNGLNPAGDDAAGDADYDDVTNAAELELGLDPQNSDSDGDGMGDGDEIANELNPLINDAAQDADGDGASNGVEIDRSLDAQDADTDNDGMSDGDEIQYNLNPLANDANSDADSDGVGNRAEINAGTSPRDRDTDDDGMQDGVELDNGLNPLVKDASSDADDDGVSNADEISLGTDPQDSDSDGDGLNDGVEVDHGLDPLLPSDAADDTDADGITNADEIAAGMDPQTADSDGDGLSDGDEVAHGLDPLDDADAAADSDGDGITNADEIEAGTDPNVVDEGETDGTPGGTGGKTKNAKGEENGCSASGAQGDSLAMLSMLLLLAAAQIWVRRLAVQGL